MACILREEQSCTECRMCRDRASGKSDETLGYETVSVQQSGFNQDQNWDIPGQISMDEYLQSLK